MLLASAPELLAALLLAVLLDALFGEPAWLYARLSHPVVLIGRAIAALETRLLYADASEASKRWRGVWLVLLLVAAGLVIGWLVSVCARLLARSGAGGFGWSWVVDGVLMAMLLAYRSLVEHVGAVADALEDSLADGRRAVACIVGRDPDSLDEAGVARASIESLAENLSDGVVAPLAWALVLGLPGMLAYKIVNTLDSMVGHRNARYRAFGWASARLDDLVNLVPARLTGLLLALAAVVTPSASGAGALRAMARDASRHRSPNAGWPEATMAGALGLRLAGPRRYSGHIVEDAWMGDGHSDVTAADIRAGLRLTARAYGLLIVMLSVALLVTVASTALPRS